MKGMDFDFMPVELRRALAGKDGADAYADAEKTGLIFPPVTGEQIQNIAYFSTSADILTPPGSHHHAGAPDKPDTNGMTKRMVYRAAINGDREFFTRLETTLNTDKQWLTLMVSKRHYRISKMANKPPRPIDVPSESKRLYGIFILSNLMKIASTYLEPTVIGFRFLNEFPQFKKRQDGATIQDVFASTVRNMLCEKGPWAVLLDLKDAYGNLPHKAIQTVLKEIGINHRERRRLIELVRIRTIEPNGKFYKPFAYGIEQGHPVSPYIFNLVMSYIIKKLKVEGVPMASYGDDVVLATGSEEEANRAFKLFKVFTDDLGFKNVRPLGGKDQKASRIINVSVEPVQLIKTFLIGKDGIYLTEDKVIELKKRLSNNPSLKEIKRKNINKVISKRYLKNILKTPVEPAKTGIKPLYPDLYGPGKAEGSIRTIGSLDTQDINRSISIIDEPYIDNTEKESYLILPYKKINSKKTVPTYRYNPTSIISSASGSTKSPDLNAEYKWVEGALNGRSADLRVGSAIGVTAGGKETGSMGRHHPVSVSVLVEDDDIKILVEGRRLKVGNRYRGCLLDLRNLPDKVPVWRIPHAIRQLTRVSSVNGRAEVLIHPGDAWTVDDKYFPDLKRVRIRNNPLGQVLTLRRETTNHNKIPSEKTKKKLPDVDIVVLSAHRWSDDARSWTVKILENGEVRSLNVMVTSMNPAIAKLEAMAEILNGHSFKTLAIPAGGFIETILCNGIKSKQVSISGANRSLRQWKWRRVGVCLIGCFK